MKKCRISLNSFTSKQSNPFPSQPNAFVKTFLYTSSNAKIKKDEIKVVSMNLIPKVIYVWLGLEGLVKIFHSGSWMQNTTALVV